MGIQENRGVSGGLPESELVGVPDPKLPSTQYSRPLAPKTISLVVFGTRVLKYWVLGPSGLVGLPPSELLRLCDRQANMVVQSRLTRRMPRPSGARLPRTISAKACHLIDRKTGRAPDPYGEKMRGKGRSAQYRRDTGEEGGNWERR